MSIATKGSRVLADEKKVAQKSSSIEDRMMGWCRMYCMPSLIAAQETARRSPLVSGVPVCATGPMKISARMTAPNEMALIK